MDNVFLFLFCISFLCIPIFIIWALINLIRKKPAKKRFKFAGVSVLTLVISIIGFGFTMDNDASLNESVDMVSEDPAVVVESTNLQPTIAPTVQPTATPTPANALTPKTTTSPTPLPTEAPTPQPTASPTPLPTATPTLQPTEIPQSSETPSPQQIETAPPAVKTSEPQVTEQATVQNTEETTNVGVSSSVEAESQVPAGDTVWLSATGTKYHRINNCGKMNPDKARQVFLEDAIKQNYEKCDKCF